MENQFNDPNITSKYTRSEAIEDGVLVDISTLSKEVGIKYPVAVTRAVFALLSDTHGEGQDFKGRAWDLLMVFRVAAKKSIESEVHFTPLFLIEGSEQAQSVAMWAKCGPGDDLEPVITIMLKGED